MPMQLPFSVEQFFDVFRRYNETLWPEPVILSGLAVAAAILAVGRLRWSSVAVSAILALLWAWLAIAYHLAFFTAINPLAYGFAAVAIAGAGIFLWQGVLRRNLQFRWPGCGRGTVGAALVVFALIVYPAWSWHAGHRYPAAPTFGLPCPTTIFTIGLLAFADLPSRRIAMIVPILWCFVGVQAAFLLGVPQDLGLVVAGVAGIILLDR